MVTREQLEEVLNDEEKVNFKTKNIDYGVKAVALLRERIPYDVCKRIIAGAEHDVVYLCDIEEAIPYLTEEDLDVLADCNCWIDDDNDSLALFV